MSKFKMVHIDVGGEVEVSFLCEHCTPTTYGRPLEGAYDRPYQSRFRQAGECPRCGGTGFDPAPRPQVQMCTECAGTGVCMCCNGRFVRSWGELPFEVQDRFTENWERGGTYPKHYASNPRISTNH